MQIFSKAIDQLTEADIRGLLDTNTPEGPLLDYKRQLPEFRAGDSKRDFLVDVSAFANSAGGTLLYGVASSAGIPESIEGLPPQNFDDLKLRMDQVLRSGIRPPIPLVQYREVATSEGNVLVVAGRIAASRSFVSSALRGRFFSCCLYSASAASKWRLVLDTLTEADAKLTEMT